MKRRLTHTNNNIPHFYYSFTHFYKNNVKGWVSYPLHTTDKKAIKITTGTSKGFLENYLTTYNTKKITTNSQSNNAVIDIQPSPSGYEDIIVKGNKIELINTTNNIFISKTPQKIKSILIYLDVILLLIKTDNSNKYKNIDFKLLTAEKIRLNLKNIKLDNKVVCKIKLPLVKGLPKTISELSDILTNPKALNKLTEDIIRLIDIEVGEVITNKFKDDIIMFDIPKGGTKLLLSRILTKDLLNISKGQWIINMDIKLRPSVIKKNIITNYTKDQINEWVINEILS